MKNSILFMIVILSLFLLSCNKDKDDEKDGPYTVPTLDFEFNVSGHTTLNANFNSPENSNTKGGHNHAVISGYTSVNDYWYISGNGETVDGVLYTFVIAFTASDLATGTYSVTQAQFATTQHGYPEFVSGTIMITDVTLGQELPVGGFYSTSGSFSIELEDQNSPSNAITFDGSFTGLHLTAN